MKGISFRPHICEQEQCDKNCEYTMQYKGETLYFCPSCFTNFSFALWVEAQLHERMQPNEENKEEPTS
jgi:hypothetical protein